LNTPPPDLSDAEVAAALAATWGIHADALAYAALGFGSHHWFATEGDTRWFVTAHDLDRGSWLGPEPLAALERAFTVARALRDEASLEFVVAQQPTRTGEVLVTLAGHIALSIYPYVEGSSQPDFGSDAQRDEALRMVAALHGATSTVADRASVDDLALPDRISLDRALADVGAAWDGGPYAEPARALLNDNADHVRHALAAYDDFARATQTARDEYVITHGEPHAQNVVFSATGPRLIDWDTAKVAPPERDLARIVTDVDEAGAYGGAVNLDRLTMYGLWWDLAEIAGYIAELRGAHTKTEDTDMAFHWLDHFIRLGEHWPGLLD
jgi:hypothetical protein